MTRARATGTNNAARQVSVNAWNAVIDKLAEVYSVEDAGAVGDGITDDTAAITAALASYSRVRLGAKTYLVSALVIPSGRTVETAGFATVIKQMAGVADGTRILSVANGARDVVLGDITVEGQIATSAGEQNHGVYIRAQTGSIHNVTIGNVRAVNIRGDAVYIGAYAGYSTDLVRVGNIICENVYRNGLTITGCGQVTVGDVSGVVGYAAIDIEPEPSYTKCDQIRIGNIKGRTAVIASSSAANYVDAVEIASLDLDPSYFGPSSPAYALTTIHGFLHRNTKSIRIGTLRANGFDGQAVKQIWNGGEIATQALHIGHCIVSNCANNEATYQSYLLGTQGVTKLTIGHLEASDTVSGDCITRGYTFADIRAVTATLVTGANLLRAVDDSTVANLSVTGGTIANGCTRTSLMGGVVNGERLFSFCSGCLGDRLTSTQSLAQLVGTVTNITIRKSTLGGTYSEMLFYANSTTATFSIDASGNASFPSYKVAGTKVVGTQGAAVADATDAASAITQLNALLARVRAHGLIA